MGASINKLKNTNEPLVEKKASASIFKKRWRKFKSLKRGYYSFIIILSLYLISFIVSIFIGRDALIVKYEGSYYFPLFKSFQGEFFKQTDKDGKPLQGEANYRMLKEQFSNDISENWVILPFYPFGPNENLLDELQGETTQPPSTKHWAGTDDRGRDVFARLVYGFNIGLSFALVVVLFAYMIGITLGSIFGFFGGKIDIFGVRVVEIWSTLPFLYVIIIISSIVQPNFYLLIFILTLFTWETMTYYIRGESYREKSRDYVSAAYSMGAKNRTIIFKHILPNSLTPVISYAPFAIVANIFSLVALDYLGFGLPPPTPSWGQLMQQGLSNIEKWWLILTPLSAMFFTLLLITFIGEAIREAFDPKVYSRLR